MFACVLAVRDKSGSSQGRHSVGEETQVATVLSVLVFLSVLVVLSVLVFLSVLVEFVIVCRLYCPFRSRYPSVFA